MYGQACVRLRATPSTDRYGDTVLDWSNPDRAPIDDVNIQPLSQDEDDRSTRSPVITTWRITSRPGVDLDVGADDRIEWDGDTWTVEGEVARWPDPETALLHHVELTIRRVRG